MRIWAAATAALHAVIERDPTALAFQDQVWHEAIAAIHDNGTIDAELDRGHRALVYHMYSFSGTLVLRAARAALGYTQTPQEHARLKLLADSIGHWLCTPHELEVLANYPQEIPGDWAYPVIDGFGADLLDNDWSRCGQGNGRVNASASGGDTRLSAELLARIAQKSK